MTLSSNDCNENMVNISKHFINNWSKYFEKYLNGMKFWGNNNWIPLNFYKTASNDKNNAKTFIGMIINLLEKHSLEII